MNIEDVLKQSPWVDIDSTTTTKSQETAIENLLELSPWATNMESKYIDVPPTPITLHDGKHVSPTSSLSHISPSKKSNKGRIVSPEKERIQTLLRVLGKQSAHRAPLAVILIDPKDLNEYTDQISKTHYYRAKQSVDKILSSDLLKQTKLIGGTRQHVSSLEKDITLDLLTRTLDNKSGSTQEFFWYGIKKSFYAWYINEGFPIIFKKMLKESGGPLGLSMILNDSKWVQKISGH